MKKQMQTVSCPKSMVGRVIGKNGETIRALQNYSGALIQIDQSTDPMKVTISGTAESVRLAISMVTDIVNGTFKGFAMLRQVTNEQAKGDATVCQPVYAPGYGLIPPSQQVHSRGCHQGGRCEHVDDRSIPRTRLLRLRRNWGCRNRRPISSRRSFRMCCPRIWKAKPKPKLFRRRPSSWYVPQALLTNMS